IYMIILGLIGLRSNATIAQENTADAKPPGRTVFMHVFLITAFNPKTIIFFLAFFPLFIDPTLNTTKQMLMMGTIFVALGAVGAVIYDLAAAKISVWIRRFSSSRIIHITTAIILCGLGLTTIFL
ncbi:MAG: LysE family transporter, partial [Pseudomonadota bacterium]